MAKELKLTSGAKLKELESAVHDRLLDMDVLRSSKRYAAAIATGIYALEIQLKVRICRTLRLDFLPKTFEIHDLEGLLVLTGYYNLLNGPSLRKSPLKRNWDEILTDAEDLTNLRYQPGGQWTDQQAKAFQYRLMDEKDGVIPWLKSLA